MKNEANGAENLPTEVSILIPVDAELGENEEIEEWLSEWLSDTYGFCHFGFSWERTGDHIFISRIDWDTSD